MKSLGLEFKVGLFVIAALGTLGYMIFVLNPDTFDSQKYVSYYTTLGDARGIVPKTHVRTNGVVVGKVTAVTLERSQTRISIDILADVEVPATSKLEVRSKGILGDVFIEVIRIPSEENLAPGGKIPVADGTVGMDELISLVGSIAKDIKKVTTTMADIFGEAEGRESIRDIVNNVNRFTKNLDEIVVENRQALNEIVQNVRIATEEIKQVSLKVNNLANDENMQRVDRIIASLDDSLIDIKATASNFKLVTDKVQRGEGAIGRLVNDDAVIEDLQGALKDLREVLAPATKLQVGVDYHGEFRKDKTSQHYFNVLFKTRTDKYFLVGLTDKENDVIERKLEQIEQEPAVGDTPAYTSTRETINEENKIRFNLQYARRWFFTTLRFGLFESTGGLAADFHLLDDKFKFTMEAFNWKSQGNEIRNVAHLKTYASLLFFNHVYLMAGIDDITRLDQQTKKVSRKPNYFFGAGMSFDDNDLKAIFGTAAIAASQ
ncbi:MAG: MCE family protein [Oligoflexales bacterium]|nr:MCE family protein [Oligoflexales bacterium]